MGYDLHLTRAPVWYESEEHPITVPEWVGLVESALDLVMEGVAEARVSGDAVLRYEDANLAVWTAHPSRDKVWFDWTDGEIVVKNPDRPTIAKMKEIAGRLHARVVGDEGEEY